MLHTFVGDDDDEVREIVREPMKEYLRSSVDLIKDDAWALPGVQAAPAGAGATPADARPRAA